MKLSIIIPVYNAEEYLEECLKSIYDCEYHDNIEVILINDGSIDNSGNICDKYSDKYKYISVYHIKNNGVSNARNLGINYAKGEYIMFMDSDDYLLPGAINIIVDEIKKYYADYIVFPFVKEDKPNSQYKYKYSYSNCIVDIESAKKAFVLDGGNAPWSKLFKRELLINENIKFNKEIKIHEDVIFCMSYLEKCNTVAYSDKSFYFYRYNAFGALRKHKIEYLENYKVVYEYWEEFLKNNDMKQKMEWLDSQFLYKFFITLGKLYKHGHNIQELTDKISNNKVYLHLINKKYANIKDKLFKLILKYKLFYIIAAKVK